MITHQPKFPKTKVTIVSHFEQNIPEQFPLFQFTEIPEISITQSLKSISDPIFNFRTMISDNTKWMRKRKE
jgi:hypothetical protein